MTHENDQRFLVFWLYGLKFRQLVPYDMTFNIFRAGFWDFRTRRPPNSPFSSKFMKIIRFLVINSYKIYKSRNPAKWSSWPPATLIFWVRNDRSHFQIFPKLSLLKPNVYINSLLPRLTPTYSPNITNEPGE